MFEGAFDEQAHPRFHRVFVFPVDADRFAQLGGDVFGQRGEHGFFHQAARAFVAGERVVKRQLGFGKPEFFAARQPLLQVAGEADQLFEHFDHAQIVVVVAVERVVQAVGEVFLRGEVAACRFADFTVQVAFGGGHPQVRRVARLYGLQEVVGEQVEPRLRFAQEGEKVGYAFGNDVLVDEGG